MLVRVDVDVIGAAADCRRRCGGRRAVDAVRRRRRGCHRAVNVDAAVAAGIAAFGATWTAHYVAILQQHQVLHLVADVVVVLVGSVGRRRRSGRCCSSGGGGGRQADVQRRQRHRHRHRRAVAFGQLERCVQ